jgi:hypothetical protein
MKRKVVGILFLLVTNFPIWAEPNSRPFFLSTAVTLNGVEVPSGLYDLKWESHDSTVLVTLWKEGRFFASAEGAWVKHGVKYASDAALVQLNSDGSHSLIEIRMAGTKKTIVFRGAVGQTVQVRTK